MAAARTPRLVLEPDGGVRVEPPDAWWCAGCGRLRVVDDGGFCASCTQQRPRRCGECGRKRAVNAAGRCKPCAATEAAEARRIADVVMAALDQRFPRRDLRPVT